MTIEPQVAWPIAALLGEGPAWFANEGALRFVDIRGGKLHRFIPATREQTTLDLGGLPSFAVPAADGGVLVGSGDGIYRLNDAAFGSKVAHINQPAHNRTNDATVDQHGRLWFGTMDDNEVIPTGALYCLDRGLLQRIGGEAVVTNGPAMSADGRTLYHVDSGARVIWRFTIGEGPAIVARDIFLELGEAIGHPDGIVLDSEDCLWVALWDGWGVRRYAPDGSLLLHVALPCARVTKIAFAGVDLRTAYVTTARIGLDAAALAEQPLAGALFTFEAPVSGRLLPAVRLV